MNLNYRAASSSIALFSAFQHKRASDSDADGTADNHDVSPDSAAFDEQNPKRFVVLKSGESFDGSRSSNRSVVVVCNTHLFSHNAGDAVRLLQVGCDV